MTHPKSIPQPELDLGLHSKPHRSVPTAALQLVGGGAAGSHALTKEQKRFNQLVKKIKATRAKIEQFNTADQELRSLGQKLILPAEEEFMRALRKLVLAMHASPHQSKLTKRHKLKFREVMLLEITMLLKTLFHADDAELQKLFGIYSESGISYEEMQEATEKLEREAAAEMFGMFGMDIDAEDLNDPAKLKEVIDAQFDGLHEKENMRQGSRKKTKAQLDVESKRQAAADAVKKTTRQIYLDLVKHCHPDREHDEFKRAEKTVWMQNITAAYEADDHLRLLEMQMTLLAERENAFADFNDSELRYFNESLQRQLAELENEVMMAHPMHTGNMFGSLYHPNRNIMMRELQTEQSSLKHRTNAVGRDAQLITSEQGFRRYIADYQMPRQQDLEFAGLGDIFS